MAPVILIPGLGDSGPEHWQSLWQKRLPGCDRVVQADWDKPDREDWIRRLDAAIQRAKSPPILVAHSLACSLVACWAAQHSRPVHAALLVGPPDIDHDVDNPPIHVFRPLPMRPLPFRTIVVASRNDPYVAFPRAAAMAQAWGAELVDAGNAGHINTSAGYGAWPDGERLLTKLGGVLAL
jgi:predicted alpha/beta hydrolase family esterase